MWAFFAISMVGICVSIVFLIRKFAAKNVSLIIRLATAYAWLTAMMVIALVPIDCWAAYAPPDSVEGIVILWNIAYWSTQASTWLVMPFFQVYADAGDFSVKNRCWTSLKENALLYGGIGAVGLVGVLIILATVGLDHWEDLLSIAVFASNFFGLVAGLILMGYGLVKIPSTMWITSNPETELKWCAHRCGKFAEAVMQSTNELRTVVIIIYANQKQMRGTDALKPFMDIISSEAEKDSPIKPSIVAQEDIDLETLKAEDLEYNYDKKGLSGLRRRMFWAIADYQGARAQYERAMLEAFVLEDVIKCRSTKDYTPRVAEGKWSKPWTKPLWTYKCAVRPHANKVFAVLLGITSCLLVWGEVTVPFTSADYSPFSRVLHMTGLNEFIFQLATVLPLVYMCACCYYALFKINIDNKYFQFNYNKLIVGATTGASLMQNGSLMCRFAAPTCWNFYHIIRYAKDYCPLDSQQQGLCTPTVFSSIMASMADINQVFNINMYLPVILVVHCAMVALGIWARIFNLCVSDRFKFSTDDVDDEYTEKGRLLVRKEQEATGKGFAIGEVLHSAYFDLEFPTIANYGRYGQRKKGFFSSLFKKKADKAAPMTAPTPASMQPAKPMSAAAAAAAAKWLHARDPNAPAPSGDAQPEVTDDRAALLPAKGMDTYSSNMPGPAKASTGGGLDGLFAGFSSKPPMSTHKPTSTTAGSSWPGPSATSIQPLPSMPGLASSSKATGTVGNAHAAPASSGASFTSTKLVFGTAPSQAPAPSSSGASFSSTKLFFGNK